MVYGLLFSALLLQAGVAARQPAPPAATSAVDWLVVVATPVYQPDGAVMSETTTLPTTGSGLVHVFARKSVCDPAVAGTAEPKDAGFGWRVASQIVSRSDLDVVVSLDWVRLWDGGRRLPKGTGGTVQLTLHPGDRIPLDFIPNASPRADCRAVGLGLEVRLGRAASPSSVPPPVLPIGATPGGAKAVDAELWMIHKLPSGTEQVMHQVVRVPAAGGTFGFAPAPVETARGKMNVQLTGSFSRYRTPAGGEFVVLSINRLVTGEGLPPAGVSAATSANMALPTEALQIGLTDAGRGRGGADPSGGGTRGGGGGGGRGGGGAGARGAGGSGSVAAGAGVGAAGGTRAGGGGADANAIGLAQLQALLEGHQFALKLRVTEVK